MTRALSSLLDLERDALLLAAGDVTSGAAPGTPLAGRVVAVLPFGPTTLPAAAWIAAAGRLGATVLRPEDLGPERGGGDEFAVVREAARWADLLVTSHPWTGYARAAAELTGRPVVNAGEGAGEDPVAGISLLAAALDEHGRRAEAGGRPLHAAVCGDLRTSRSAHAFLSALAAIQATVLLVPARGRDLPEDALRRLARCMGVRPHRFEARSMQSLLDMVDTVLLTPEDAAQLPLFEEVDVPPGEAARRARRHVEDLDVLFVAASGGVPDRLVRSPFRSRRRDVPEGAEHRPGPAAVAAALTLVALGESGPDGPADGPGARYRSARGLRCRGEGCVGGRAPEAVRPDFLRLLGDELECLYCGARTTARFAGSREVGRFHATGSADAARVLTENLVLFRTRGEALAAGFVPSRRDVSSPGSS